ncbi:hypothetical protein C5Y96_23855 [Blastopirellula marina]|uniref:SxtJ n=1 Tax=Blastopirellula marina TaxID=124 RepID=A0A2S8EZN5_9BACT|nr:MULTISPECIES: hypothetical protein [Pirellulaceae]PQO25379.1 hypothetical protein C5Y96_23855 [Blastopirellula marina]RCS42343.1 hypothetical protein DTL36_23905 [Bremerella cremea]
MVLVDIKAKPSASMQRWFGLSLTALLLIVAAACRGVSPLLAIAVAVLAVLVCVAYYLVPATRLPIIRTWQVVTFPIAFVVSHVLLLVTYFGVFLPVGIVMRLLGHDPLQLKEDDRDSYWVQRPTKPTSTDRYFKQF